MPRLRTLAKVNPWLLRMNTERSLDNQMLCGCCSRRALLLGLSAWASTRPALAAVPAKPLATTLVLTCIDYRFLPTERIFLEHIAGQHDWVALAGSALAFAGFPHRAETKTLWDQLSLAHRLHGTQRVVIIDHQDCGAYALKLGSSLSHEPERELIIHRHYLHAAASAIRHRYPNLEVETYFATLGGKILPL